MKTLALIVGMASGLAFGQEAIEIDMSEMKGSPVARAAEPSTNKLVLYRAVPSVDGAAKQLREQGDTTNLVKKLVESGE